MSKKVFRYFGGLLTSQERWLNKMAADGYRLTHTTKAAYEFEPCTPGQYQYRVEFIAQKSSQSAEDFARFLKDCGYQVFFKNINLSYSIGKVQARPWAEKGGRLAAKTTTLHRELLIVEKEADQTAFDLHTTNEDRAQYMRQLCGPWLFMLLIFLVSGILTKSPAFLIAAAVFLLPVTLYQREIIRLKKEANTTEW